MKIIYFDENQKEDWNNFVAQNSDDGGLLQSWQWSNFQKVLGKKIWRIGIRNKKENLLLTCFAFSDSLALGQKTIEVYRGPIISKKQKYSQEELKNILDVLLKELKKIGREEKAIVARIDFGIKKNEFNLKLTDLKRANRDIQPRSTILINLEDSEENILAQMKSKHRYNIRLSQRKGVKVFLCNLDKNICNDNFSFRDGFEKFWKLTKITSQRDKFAIHDRDYYWKLLNNPQNMTQLYLAVYKNEIIAGAIVGCFGNMCTYLHGASDNKFRNIMAPYLLQWQAIRYTKNNKKKYYDLGGVKSEGENSSSQKGWSGITRFKKGFCPESEVIEFLGLWNLPLNKFKYDLYNFLRFIIKLFKK